MNTIITEAQGLPEMQPITASLAELEAELTDIREREKALVERKKAIVGGVFHAKGKSVFDEHPKLLAFRWTQYTPYFNDGDTCTFSSNHEYPSLAFSKDGDELVWDEEPWFKDDDKSEEAAACRAVCALLSNFDDDDMEEMFGDHAEITVTRDGATVEEYSHS